MRVTPARARSDRGRGVLHPSGAPRLVARRRDLALRDQAQPPQDPTFLPSSPAVSSSSATSSRCSSAPTARSSARRPRRWRATSRWASPRRALKKSLHQAERHRARAPAPRLQPPRRDPKDNPFGELCFTPLGEVVLPNEMPPTNLVDEHVRRAATDGRRRLISELFVFPPAPGSASSHTPYTERAMETATERWLTAYFRGVIRHPLVGAGDRAVVTLALGAAAPPGFTSRSTPTGCSRKTTRSSRR